MHAVAPRLHGVLSHAGMDCLRAARRSCAGARPPRRLLAAMATTGDGCSSTCDVARVDAADLTAATFAREFLATPPAARLPCVIRGLELGDVDGWTIEGFCRDFGDAELWDKEQLVTRRVEDFLNDKPTTAAATAAESYLFEFLGPECGAPPSAHVERIRNSYRVPERVFGPDLWSLGAAGDYLATLERPEHRWVLVGKRGSGSGLHVDPNGTCAWNKSLVGRKRWVLFEPLSGDPFHVPAPAAGTGGGADAEAGAPPPTGGVVEVPFTGFKVDELSNDTARNALIHAGLLSARELFGSAAVTGDDGEGYGEGDSIHESGSGGGRGGGGGGDGGAATLPVWARAAWEAAAPCYDFVQHPGETVFVPAGYWHAVLNLDATLAITQNWSPPCDMDRVLDELSRHPGGRTTAARWKARFLDAGL